MSILRKMTDLLGDLGFFVRRNLTSLGLAARMFAAVIWRSGFLLKRPRLISDQILFLGNYSFVIISVSGFFVGCVLG
jgi:phospholipid/cholesterol/gamma-HCH transport system permease protein